MPTAPHILDVDLPEEKPAGEPAVRGGDYQHIETNPNMFGGAFGHAEQSLGEGVTRAADTGLQILTQKAELQNDVYNVDLNSQFNNDLSNLHAKFMNFEGRAASDNLPGYQQQVDTIKKNYLSQQTSPSGYAKLNAALSSGADRYLRIWGGHAGEQMHTYDKTVTANAIASHAGAFGNFALAGDEASATTALNNQSAEVRNYYDAQHYAPAEIEAEVRKSNGITLSETIGMMVKSGNPTGAQKLFNDYKDRMDLKSRASATSVLRTATDDIKAIGIIDDETKKTTTKPFDLAQKMVGVSGTADHGVLTQFLSKIGGQNIDPATTPWCAAWANSVLRASGYSGTGSAAARSFLNYGTATSEPQQGDIVVLSRGADPSKGHVGFYAGPGDTPGTIKILGGNQGNAVSIAQFPAANVLGFRRLAPGDVVGKAPPVGPGPSAFTDNKAAILDSILNRDDLRSNPLLRDAAVRELNRRASVQQASFAQTEHEERMKKIASDDTAGGYVTQYNDMIAGKSSTSDFLTLRDQINHDPKLNYTTKESLIERIGKFTGQEKTEAFGTGYVNYRHGLFSAAGTPGHINSWTDLIEKDDLTPAGLANLQELTTKARGSIDRQAIEKQVNFYLAGMKKHLSVAEDTGFMKIRDPEGEDIFNNQFAPRFVKQVSKLEEDAEKTGDHSKLDAFLNDKSVLKFAESFRSPTQLAVAKMKASNNLSDPNAPPPPPPENVDAKVWTEIVAQPPVMPPLNMKATASQYGIALKALHDAPTPQAISSFDKWFGVKGAMATDILGKMGIKVEPKAEPQAAPQEVPQARPAATNISFTEPAKTVPAQAAPKVAPANNELAHIDSALQSIKDIHASGVGGLNLQQAEAMRKQRESEYAEAATKAEQERLAVGARYQTPAMRARGAKQKLAQEEAVTKSGILDRLSQLPAKGADPVSDRQREFLEKQLMAH